MPESNPLPGRHVAPADVADALAISIDEVLELVFAGRLRGSRIGTPPQWRIMESSVLHYLDDQAEETRRIALWRQSNAASFPELWGKGAVRNPD